MPLFRISTLYCDPCPPIQIAPFLPVPVLSEKRPALLLLLINVFGIPDQRCADFLFIPFPLRLPPPPFNLIDCFILTGRYLLAAPRP